MHTGTMEFSSKRWTVATPSHMRNWLPPASIIVTCRQRSAGRQKGEGAAFEVQVRTYHSPTPSTKMSARTRPNLAQGPLKSPAYTT